MKRKFIVQERFLLPFFYPVLSPLSTKIGTEEYQCVYQGRFYEVASIIGYSTSSGDGRTRIIVSRAIACISSWLRLELEFVIRHAANQRSVADFMEIRMDRVRSDPVILSIVKISFSFFFQISFQDFINHKSDESFPFCA